MKSFRTNFTLKWYATLEVYRYSWTKEKAKGSAQNLKASVLGFLFLLLEIYRNKPYQNRTDNLQHFHFFFFETVIAIPNSS